VRLARHEVLPGGFGFPIGFGGGFAIAAATVELDDRIRPLVAMIGLAILVAVISAVTTLPAAAATATACWGLYASFAIGTRGDMAFDRAAAVGLGVLLLATAFGAAARAAPRARQRPMPAGTEPSVPAPRLPTSSEVDRPAPAKKG
jgi:hypothetical protein